MQFSAESWVRFGRLHAQNYADFEKPGAASCLKSLSTNGARGLVSFLLADTFVLSPFGGCLKTMPTQFTLSIDPIPSH